MFELTSKASLLVVCWVYHLITVSELGFFHDAWKKEADYNLSLSVMFNFDFYCQL